MVHTLHKNHRFSQAGAALQGVEGFEAADGGHLQVFVACSLKNLCCVHTAYKVSEMALVLGAIWVQGL